MSAGQAVAVSIQGRNYKIRSDEDPEFLRRVAAHVDETMERLGGQAGVVDSLDVAMLAAINLAREALSAQDAVAPEDRIGEMIELTESALHRLSR